MTDTEAIELAKALIANHCSRAFDISLPDVESYALMRRTLSELGRESEPGGDFFAIAVLPKKEDELDLPTDPEAARPC
jgi:hypothetical protein